ncbi:alpha/beta fold hydrolase [Leptolyngbya sp. FACHB-261]|uniref:alpha/beta fold hydrolase n=1 Tax=Leptolyngbya sp. FACHB-261 TaxID=2692806 RepID=UPI0016851711|nr:alpha/beta fold hydrolase [Leptolyngbya sp. FACHB-261]MBD2103795.1 alpha/beta fold hydrolase [Leptolyngbya sp. FACHB-261]
MTATASTSVGSGTYWTWRGQPIYYVKAGNNPTAPPLLLIHGFGASTDHWRKNIEGLQDHCEVWAIDLLGFGRSAKPEWTYHTDLWRSQLQDFIEQVVQRAVVVAGNSLGGYVSLSLGVDAPELVRGVVLVNSAGSFTNPDQPPLAQRLVSGLGQSILRQPWASFLLFQYMRQRSKIREILENVYLDHSAITDQLVDDIYRPSCDPGAPQVFASVFSSPSGRTVDELLKHFKLPLLMLWGEADPWMNAQERASRFRDCYPQLTEHFLKAGHCPHDEVPEQVNDLIERWLQSLSTAL